MDPFSRQEGGSCAIDLKDEGHLFSPALAGCWEGISLGGRDTEFEEAGDLQRERTKFGPFLKNDFLSRTSGGVAAGMEDLLSKFSALGGSGP